MLLEINHVTKSFGGVVATNDVSVSVPEGKILSIIGPNGAGKTTLFNLITGAYMRTSGTITFNGVKIDTMKPYEIHALGVARTFQNIRLFKRMTVLENVMTGMHSRIKARDIESFIPGRSQKIEEEITEKSMEALKIVGLDGKYAEYGAALPYGQQRRLEIARALVSDPKLLLLDEPAAGMNINESAELLELIRWINAELKKTVIFIEHNMKVVMNVSDYIVVLDHGSKIAEGIPKEIRKNPVVIEAYLGTKKEGGNADA
ncbi:MAG: ABC transporter ATP-binding protein [Dorea sp.]|nr:ABC transporter ATP-binding protein [Dorea sp.]